jgi:magnesium transporter
MTGPAPAADKASNANAAPTAGTARADMTRAGGPPPDFPSSGTPGPTRIRAVREGLGNDLDLAGLARTLADGSSRVWVDLTEPTLDHLATVAAVLGLHPLVAENIGERAQRAKIEQVDDHIRIVLFAMEYVGEVRPIELDFVLGERFLLTVHADTWDPFRAPQLRGGIDPILGKGPDYLFYALGDWIVDGYFPALDRLADEIDVLQDDAIQRASTWTLQRLFVLKRELLLLRRATSPAREVFNQLTNRETNLIAAEHVIYLRDVYDHLLRVTDELDNYRELVAGTMEVYLSTVNNNLSAIMKRLTSVTVLLAGIGAVGGVFGMSEAGAALAGDAPSGFWLVTVTATVIAATAAIFLRRIDWI